MMAQWLLVVIIKTNTSVLQTGVSVDEPWLLSASYDVKAHLLNTDCIQIRFGVHLWR